MHHVNYLGVGLLPWLPMFFGLFKLLFHTCFLQHYYLIFGHLGARFGFLLDEELKKAASCDEVKDALAAKISRERIGVEVCVLSWCLSCFEH